MTLVPGFTGGLLDRADALRHDPAALSAKLDWRARLLKLDGLMPQIEDGRLAWTSLADLPDDAEIVLLGLDAQDRAHVAALLPASGEGTTPAMRSPALMAVLGALEAGEAATYAAARSLLDWHARHRFCARCGSTTHLFRAGWGRQCDACYTEHFPRVDPVVIMIAEHDGRALLGRGKGWPEGRYSALAGFLEPGESIEEAVAREIHEEAGVRVTGVRYVSSQPWPFPSSLMIACIGEAEDDAITLDTTELEDAMWVPRDLVRAVLAGEPGPFVAPPSYAIAHTLLTEWARRDG
ncbi:NAD(+) diphosphatase [Sphingomonadaceae bacterium OTU29MARTA1]|uniref:NAD(+) diphosphatase n=1 Tax=Sphingomonas sp. Leaf37 TaxID=2876552 RepID=UPI001E65CDD0|nr:NAD(+) diphosphatase [Sphingomonas sp. Leaf37]USU03937.1 NAD(+) diphosphatase [Sphingomonadaceae bacterium OTU29LAMAA1]USU07668.1 NAD(+) diphosphatase [Sphingomonadaceae bacterium OTU29MARTA1]